MCAATVLKTTHYANAHTVSATEWSSGFNGCLLVTPPGRGSWLFGATQSPTAQEILLDASKTTRAVTQTKEPKERSFDGRLMGWTQEVRLERRFLGTLLQTLRDLLGCLGRLLHRQAGAHDKRLRHLFWEQCGHGVNSRPKESRKTSGASGTLETLLGGGGRRGFNFKFHEGELGMSWKGRSLIALIRIWGVRGRGENKKRVFVCKEDPSLFFFLGWWKGTVNATWGEGEALLSVLYHGEVLPNHGELPI